jgi:hypothetical protein
MKREKQEVSTRSRTVEQCENTSLQLGSSEKYSNESSIVELVLNLPHTTTKTNVKTAPELCCFKFKTFQMTEYVQKN